MFSQHNNVNQDFPFPSFEMLWGVIVKYVIPVEQNWGEVVPVILEAFVHDFVDFGPYAACHLAVVHEVSCMLRSEMTVAAHRVREVHVSEPSARSLFFNVSPERAKEDL